MLTPGADPVRKVSIIPRGQALGVTFQAPAADRYGYSAKYLRGRIVGALGGRAAEEVVYSDVTHRCRERPGPGHQHRPADGGPVGHVGRRGPAHGAAAVRAGVAAGLDGVAPATKELVDREARRIVDECHDQAVATLIAHREQLDRLAHALFAAETLDEDEAYAAAGVPRDSAPGALARGDVRGVPPEPGMLPKPATDGSGRPSPVPGCRPAPRSPT